MTTLSNFLKRPALKTSKRQRMLRLFRDLRRDMYLLVYGKISEAARGQITGRVGKNIVVLEYLFREKKS